MRSLPAAIIVAAAVSLGLTGCLSQEAEGPGKTPVPSVSPHSTEQPAPGATDIPQGGYQSTPVTIECNSLVNPQAVYDYNPNYGLQPEFSPEAGSDVATILANQGLGCSWVNQTSGERFVVAVAQLADADLTGIQGGLAKTSTRASGFGDVAFFAASGGMGVAEVFQGGHWLVVASPAFYAITDAEPLIDAALAALR